MPLFKVIVGIRVKIKYQTNTHAHSGHHER